MKSLLALFVLSAIGCPSKGEGTPAPSGSATASPHAEIGKPAPDFNLNDLEGKQFHLTNARGKTVVIEWFNPECPFVRVAHTVGSLKTMADRVMAKGVVWIAIDSNAPGKQGSAREEIAQGRDKFGMKYPVLLDPGGEVGHAYGATNTPHMFVIDPSGTLVYSGAIDDTKGAEPEPNEKVTNYVDLALDAISAGKPPQTSTTKAWGCSVKYK